MLNLTPAVSVDLPADSTAPALARRIIGDVISGVTDKGGLPDQYAADVQLAVSELASNAVKYGAPPQQLRVWAAPTTIRVEVADASATSGRFFGPTDPAGGFGLGIVAALASAWGFEFHPADDGKVVWFEKRP